MIWNTIKESLQGSLPSGEYDLWIEPLACRSCSEDRLELVGPDRYFLSWVQDRYLGLIKSKLNELGWNNSDIKFMVDGPISVEAEKNTHKGQLQLPGMQIGGSVFRALHPAYTFDQFMVGESNILASTACDAIARGETRFGNSLFLNSSTGLGKSHLTQAVAHTVLSTAPGTRLHYLTAQQFSNEMVKGIKGGTMDQFTKKYINGCDILLVEDIHTLTGKTKTQDELNIILDYLLKTGRRVIFTSAKPPCELIGLDEDFKSRMTAGLVTQIQSPDYQTRFNIIRHKAMASGLTLSEEAVDYLAQHLNGDVRRIESALIGINAKANMLNLKADLDLVQDVLRDIVGQPVELNGEMIMKFIAAQYKVSPEQLRSKSRKKDISFPRQMAMFLTRKHTELSLNDIGSLYNRDHSTVMYAIKCITKEMAIKSTVKEQISILSGKLQK
ncbi:MAG: chromosomal replication initiator protein DnaA [Desulfobulbaceae bacterium]|nr:chromosomal replication initiator protein DnaA [Desulfobulbaceae bacterium]